MILDTNDRDNAMLAWLESERLLSPYGLSIVRAAAFSDMGSDHDAIATAQDLLSDVDDIGADCVSAWVRGWDCAARWVASDIDPAGFSPLSGEWAGESITELIGDLLDRCERYTEDDDTICAAYEAGYGAVRDAWHHGVPMFHGDAECAF